MAIVTVSTSNTFNEWRVVTNQLVTEVNKTESGTAALSVDTLTANTVTANGDIAVNGGDLTTTQTTANLFNTTATTLNLGGAATTVEIGAATGTTNVNNNLDVDGDVNIDGGDLTVSTASFNLANTNATTLNVGGAATALNLGAATGTTTIRNNASVSGNTTIGGTLGVTGNVTLSGELRGPSTFTIDPAVVGDDTGTVVIKGNLQVDGTTTTINSTTLTVDDLNIVLASGAANAAAANGAGITIDGASATITYLSSGDKFSINKAVDFAANPILTGGTVNGITYLNASKVLTSGSLLTFDGAEAFALNATSTGGTVSGTFGNGAANGYAAVILKNTGASGKTYEIGVGGNGTSGQYQDSLYFRDQTGNPLLSINTSKTILSSGSILIGRTSSTLGGGNGAQLQIGSGSSAAGMTIHTSTTTIGDIQFADGTVGDASYRGLIRYDHSVDRMEFWSAASGRLYINSSGNVQIGTTTDAGALTVSGKIRTLSGDIELDSGQITTNSDANSLRLGVNGSEKVRITNAGRVGIGTTNPGYQLVVTDGSRIGLIHPRSTAAGTGLAVGVDVGVSSAHVLNLMGDLNGGSTSGGVNIGYYSSTSGNWYAGLSIRNTSSAFGNLTLMQDGGNVGIGVTNPSNTLEVPNQTSVSVNTSVFPTSRPNVIFDFAKSKVLDPRFTYARASTGTYYDANSSTKCDENLVTYSNNFSNSGWTYDNVTLTGGQTAPDRSSTAVLMNEGTGNSEHRIYQTIGAKDFSASTSYTYSVYLKYNNRRYVFLRLQSGAGTGGVMFDLVGNSVASTGGSLGASGTMTAAGDGWYRCTCTVAGHSSGIGNWVIAMSNTLSYSDNISYTGTSSSVYVWGAQLENGTSATSYKATTTDAIRTFVPTLRLALSAQPRFDHDPITKESLGLLLEPAATNLWINSEHIDGSIYNVEAGSHNANTAIAPDGTLTADTITEGTNFYTRTTQSMTVVNGQTYTYSVYLKANLRGRAQMQIYSNSTNIDAVFDLISGTIVSNTGTAGTASIQSVGAGWYRCAVTATVGSTTAIAFVYPVETGGSGYSYSHYDGLPAINVWGHQFELNSSVPLKAYATSYIKTVGSTATRSRDIATMSSTSGNYTSWFSNDEMTIYYEYKYQKPDIVQGQFVAGIGRDSGEYLGIGYAENAPLYVQPSTGSVITTGNWYATAGQKCKIAISIASDSVKVNANGKEVTVATGDRAHLADVWTEFSLGYSAFDGSYTTGQWVSKFIYWPVESTTQQLSGIVLAN